MPSGAILMYLERAELLRGLYLPARDSGGVRPEVLAEAGCGTGVDGVRSCVDSLYLAQLPCVDNHRGARQCSQRWSGRGRHESSNSAVTRSIHAKIPPRVESTVPGGLLRRALDPSRCRLLRRGSPWLRSLGCSRLRPRDLRLLLRSHRRLPDRLGFRAAPRPSSPLARRARG